MKRRDFLNRAGQSLLLFAGPRSQMKPEADSPSHDDGKTTLFLCGDVMTGRGIDQALPYPSKPHLYEPYMDSALGYVELA